MNAESLAHTLAEGFRSNARVRVRRPNRIYQVELPAYLADGDAAQIFVVAEKGGAVQLSDLGMTRMRLSYRRTLGAADDGVLALLAERHGFSYTEGAFQTSVSPEELFAGALGLAQIQAQADAAVVAGRAKAERTERFKSVVREVLEAAFRDRIEFGYSDPTVDPAGLYPIDAVIHGGLDLFVAVVPSDIEAERAVANRHFYEPNLKRRHRWAVVPRDLEALAARSRKRLLQAYLAPVPDFAEGRSRIPRELADLAEAG